MTREKTALEISIRSQPGLMHVNQWIAETLKEGVGRGPAAALLRRSSRAATALAEAIPEMNDDAFMRALERLPMWLDVAFREAIATAFETGRSLHFEEFLEPFPPGVVHHGIDVYESDLGTVVLIRLPKLLACPGP